MLAHLIAEDTINNHSLNTGHPVLIYSDLCTRPQNITFSSKHLTPISSTAGPPMTSGSLIAGIVISDQPITITAVTCARL